MRFLYKKEWLAREVPQSERGAFVGSLYETRGHSSDTQLKANYSVHHAFSVLKAFTAGQPMRNVLIVGPGLELAPRTGFRERYGPQTYQPYAVADTLLALKVARPDEIRIHCVDINELVVKTHWRHACRTGRRTRLGGYPELREYVERFGKHIGSEMPTAANSEHDAPVGVRLLAIRREVRRAITADRLNIISERYDPPPSYDLSVITNVFPYLSRTELALALSNVHFMLRPGGYLVHNDFRPEVEDLTRVLSLTAVQTRTIQLTRGDEPLFDGFVIHKKESRR